MLKTMEWNLNLPTAYTFADVLLPYCILPHEHEISNHMRLLAWKCKLKRVLMLHLDTTLLGKLMSYVYLTPANYHQTNYASYCRPITA